MFGTSGVRGPFGETVDAELALSIGRALATDGAETVVVGRDPRLTGPLLADAASAGARECGADVVDLGVVATPTIARSVDWYGADAGIAVTASHNPPADNGLKLWDDTGMAFSEARRERIAEIVEQDGAQPAAWDAVGDAVTRGDAAQRHSDAIVDAVSIHEPLSVVVDVGNGAGQVTADVLRRLGCAVETLGGEPDGLFPSRASEPTAEACGALAAHVAATDADLGIAHDGDGDRAMAVDETGRFLSGDELLALFAREAVAGSTVAAGEGPAGVESDPPIDDGDPRDGAEPADRGDGGDRVVVPVGASLAIDDVVTGLGGRVERSRVGDVYVAERARAPGVVFGGEPSGAWIWPDETLAPDGPLAAARLAALVAAGEPLSEQVAALPSYPIERDQIEVDPEDKAPLVDAVARHAAEAYGMIDERDGVRVETEDGWFLVRASGTQPLVRITAQGRTEEATAALAAEAGELLAEARQTV